MEDNIKESVEVDLTRIDPKKKILAYIKMLNILKNNASRQNESIDKVINDFISDLNNYEKEGYESKIKNIKLNGITSKGTIKECINFMQKRLKDEQQKEEDLKAREMDSKWQQVKNDIEAATLSEEQGIESKALEKVIFDIQDGKSGYELDEQTQQFVLKKLKDRLAEVKNREKEVRKSAEKAMETIEEIVKREAENGNIKNKVEYFKAIKDAITGEKAETSININLEGEAQKQLLHMLDSRIEKEKDDIYFEQVKDFTDGFEFLKEYPEQVRARQGNAQKKKFTDMEAYKRFTSLRELLQKEHSEHIGIQLLIESGEIDDADAKILLARKEVMDKEFARKRMTEGKDIR